MSYTINEAKTLLHSKPRCELGFFPTPLHRLDRLSEDLGIDLYMKRDDLPGRSLFGGNKIRKLEYLIGDALAKGAEYVFTYGATQSNHAMQTATACRKAGLKPILYLTAVVPVDENDVRSNLFLDQVLGAEIHIVRMLEGETEDDADERALQMAAIRRQELEKEGHVCYDVPMGGANRVGSIGFADGYLELTQQMQALGKRADFLYHATGTAGTMAGLAAGRKLIGSDTRIVSVNVSKKDDSYLKKAADLANQTLEYLGVTDVTVDPAADVEREGEFYQPGYEMPGKESTEAIKYLAQREGLFVDPVYSGKALAALIAHVKSGKIPQGSCVVFWHTGGATALFAEHEIVGDLSNTLIYDH